MRSCRRGLGRLCFAVTAAAALSGNRLQAQGGVHMTPSIRLDEQYDSNVFSTAIEPESDFITRATMGLEIERGTALWTATGRYLQDMEGFSDHRDLSSVAARQRGTLGLRYRPSVRTSWSADAELWRTSTPSELNEATGLTVSRAPAQRLLARSSLNRHLTPVTSATLDYTVTQDHVVGRTSATTHDAVAAVERHRSQRETLTLKYRFREFRFAPAAASDTFVSTSHALTVGWSRALSRRLQLTFEGGPRVTHTTPGADVAASIHYQRLPDVSVSYTRSQATVIGSPGVSDVQSLSAAIEWPMSSSLRLRLAPGLFRNQLGNARVDACVVAFDVTRPIAHDVMIDLSVNSNLQRGGLNPGMTATSINRRVVLVRLIAGPSSLLW